MYSDSEGFCETSVNNKGSRLWRAMRCPSTSTCALSIPPEYRVGHTIGVLRGKPAIRIHRECLGQKRNFTGLHFWAKGYVENRGRFPRDQTGDRQRPHPDPPSRRGDSIICISAWRQRRSLGSMPCICTKPRHADTRQGTPPNSPSPTCEDPLPNTSPEGVLVSIARIPTNPRKNL